MHKALQCCVAASKLFGDQYSEFFQMSCPLYLCHLFNHSPRQPRYGHCGHSLYCPCSPHHSSPVSPPTPWDCICNVQKVGKLNFITSHVRQVNITVKTFRQLHGEIIHGGTRWIEDDFSATFSEYIFLFPACLMISHWLTKNAELNSVFQMTSADGLVW